MRPLCTAAVLVAPLLAAGCAKDPVYADDTGAAAPEACEAYSMSVAQELGPGELVAAETEEPWIDRASIIGPGGALADFDGDGFLDLAVAVGVGSSRLLLNDGTGTLVADLATELPPAHTISSGDLDGDGHTDLFLGTWEGEPDLIALGDGSGGFSTSELPGSTGHSTTGSFGDHDNDGDLDLIVTRFVVWPDYDDVQAGTIEGGGNIIYDNDGNGVFTASERLPAEHFDDLSHHAQWLDVDADGDLDLYFSNDFGMFLDPNLLLLNDGSGTFERVGDGCNCELGIEAMGVAVGDFDGQSDPDEQPTPDLYITDIGGNHLLINEGNATFYDSAKASGVDEPLSADHMAAWGTTAVDLDLDGDMDLPVNYGPLAFWDEDLIARFWDEDGNEYRDSLSQLDLLYLNDGTGSFEDASEATGFADDRIAKSLSVGDLDRDGRPDLVTVGWTTELEPFVLVRNGVGGCGGGVTLKLPSDAVGTRVEVFDGDLRVQTQWLVPSTTYSSSAFELYLATAGAPEVSIRMHGLGGTSDWAYAAPGEVVDLSGY